MKQLTYHILMILTKCMYLLVYKVSCTKLQLPPEPLNMKLRPPGPCSLCPCSQQLNLLNPPQSPPLLSRKNFWVRHWCRSCVNTVLEVKISHRSGRVGFFVQVLSFRREAEHKQTALCLWAYSACRYTSCSRIILQ